MSDEFFIFSFYRFIELKNIEKLKKDLDKYLSNITVKGTILIANEGINGSIAATKEDLENFVKFLKSDLLNIRKLEIKVNKIDFLPFNKIKVRLKKEIVSLGKGKINTNHNKSNYLNPIQWNIKIKNKNTKIIDVRNNFEIDIGKFKNAINPNTKTFREFPDSFQKLKINKKSHIAIYCTGGIRCEKASKYLQKEGYKHVYQLKGGILNYLNYTNKNKEKSLWNGECFVFDERVAVNKSLDKGSYLQCYGCRRPIRYKDTKSKKYIKGVQCSYCYKERSDKQKERSLTRQMQIDKFEDLGIDHAFKKVSKS